MFGGGVLALTYLNVFISFWLIRICSRVSRVFPKVFFLFAFLFWAFFFFGGGGFLSKSKIPGFLDVPGLFYYLYGPKRRK